MSVTVELKTNHLPQLAEQIERAAARAVEETALAIGVEAERNCPVDTGALRSSIRVEQEGPLAASVHEGGNGVDYAAYVEFGTRRQAAQPHFYPAAEAERPKLLDRFREELGG